MRQASPGLEAAALDLLVGDYVIPLVRIFTQRVFSKIETWNLLGDCLAKLALGDVRFGQSDIVSLVLHPVEVVKAERESLRRVPDMQVVPLEIRFKKYHETVSHRPEHKIIDQQVGSHPWACSKDSRQPQSNDIPGFEKLPLDFHLQRAVQADGSQRGLLGAVLALFPHPVTTVGSRKYDTLFFSAECQNIPNRVTNDRGCADRVALAKGGAC